MPSLGVSNGERPNAIANMQQPRPQMSTRSSTLLGYVTEVSSGALKNMISKKCE